MSSILTVGNGDLMTLDASITLGRELIPGVGVSFTGRFGMEEEWNVRKNFFNLVYVLPIYVLGYKHIWIL